MDYIILPPDNQPEQSSDENLLGTETASRNAIENNDLNDQSFIRIAGEEIVEDIYLDNSHDTECEINMFEANPSETYYYYNEEDGDQIDEFDQSENDTPPLPPGCLPEDMPSPFPLAPHHVKNTSLDFGIGKSEESQILIPSDNLNVPLPVDNNENSKPLNVPESNNIPNTLPSFVNVVPPLPPDAEMLENIMNIPPPPPLPSKKTPDQKSNTFTQKPNMEPQTFSKKFNPQISGLPPSCMLNVLPPPPPTDLPPEEKAALDEDSRYAFFFF